jgi:hypothetical protein
MLCHLKRCRIAVRVPFGNQQHGGSPPQ